MANFLNDNNKFFFQLVINTILNEVGLDSISSINLKEKLESMIPYTDRHFKRVTKLYQDLHLLTYTISSMKSHIAALDNPDKDVEL